MVKLAVAGQQSLPEQHLGALEHPALGEIGLVGDQDVADPIGMAHQVGVLPGELHVGQVAVGARDFEQVTGRVLAEARQDTEQHVRVFGTRRASKRDGHDAFMIARGLLR
jgi:hypothetical protein